MHSRKSKSLTARVVPQKYSDHFVTLFRHGSIKKYWNSLRAVLNYLCQRANIESLPLFLKVEASNQCHVHCKYCYVAKTGGYFDFQSYKRLIDKLGDYIFEVSLHDIGEPLLNDRIIDFISYAYKRNVGTTLSTSLSVEKREEFWHQLVTSGLDRLIAAIDGTSPEIYNEYRTNGNLELVLHNLSRILHYGRATNACLRVTWQMIDFSWNKNEQTIARKLSKKMGCHDFRLIHEETKPRQDYFRNPRERTRNCLMSYLMFIVNAQGKVRPCCNIYRGITDKHHHENLVGDLKTESFEEVWNGLALQQVRSRKYIITRDYCRHCQEM